jgi:hypothetical protein
MWPKRGVLPLIVAVAAAIAAAASEPADAATCSFSGASWTQADQMGSLYHLETRGVTCGYAVPWARKLAALRSAKPFAPIKGGPAGWVCKAEAPAPRIVVGACTKGTQRFSWSAAAS